MPEPASPTGIRTQGERLAEISNAVTRLVREHVGRGPTEAKSYWEDDIIVCVLRGGFTRAEKSLFEAGRAEVVEETRRALQDVLERELKAAVEQLTGRRVAAFLSANHHEPDVSVEIFVLEPAPSGGDG